VVDEFRDNMAIDGMYSLPNSIRYLVLSWGRVVAAFLKSL